MSNPIKNCNIGSAERYTHAVVESGTLFGDAVVGGFGESCKISSSEPARPVTYENFLDLGRIDLLNLGHHKEPTYA